jgi:hypothetical protein
MIRTLFASISVSGVSVAKGFFSLKAQTDLDEKGALAGRLEKIVDTVTFSGFPLRLLFVALRPGLPDGLF